MNIAYFNGEFLPKDNIHISPDDRGFLFGDGIYEVMKWYGGSFFDMESHQTRLKRSLKEICVNWHEADTFPSLANELIRCNNLAGRQAIIYLQVTRGAAPRTHSFPDPEVKPTVYAYAKEIFPPSVTEWSGVTVMLKKDIRWSRCDIKSVALLANTLSFQEASEKGMSECIFVRDGVITEGSRSNIFFVSDGTLFTHPESDYILSGVTRKNALRYAKEAGIKIKEEPFKVENLGAIQEAFITNTSAEITPVIAFNSMTVCDGMPGAVTTLIRERFLAEVNALKG